MLLTQSIDNIGGGGRKGIYGVAKTHLSAFFSSGPGIPMYFQFSLNIHALMFYSVCCFHQIAPR